MDVEEKQVQNANGSSLQYLTDQSPGHDRVPGQQQKKLSYEERARAIKQIAALAKNVICCCSYRPRNYLNRSIICCLKNR